MCCSLDSTTTLLLLQILKKNEQMYALLAIILALSPAAQRILDENVVNMLREKYEGDYILRHPTSLLLFPIFNHPPLVNPSRNSIPGAVIALGVENP